MPDDETRARIAEMRQYATRLRASVHVQHAGADLIEQAADALEASLPVPDGDAREVNYCPTHGDLLALGDRRSRRCREAHSVEQVLAAFPVLFRDIAGEIDAEREAEWVKVSDRGQAYRDGLRRAAEIVRNGR